MAYTHLTMKELSWIESYFDTGLKPYKIAKKISNVQIAVGVFVRSAHEDSELFGKIFDFDTPSGARLRRPPQPPKVRVAFSDNTFFLLI